jgi:predicted thioesterase
MAASLSIAFCPKLQRAKRISPCAVLANNLEGKPDMKTGLTIGAKREEHFNVTKELSVQIGKASVLSTPSLVWFMERTSRLILEPYLMDGEASVGANIKVVHLAPAPTSSEVRVVSHVVSVAGRRIDFSIEAYDAFEKIGEATHQRVVVTVSKFETHMEEKLSHRSAS